MRSLLALLSIVSAVAALPCSPTVATALIAGGPRVCLAGSGQCTSSTANVVVSAEGLASCVNGAAPGSSVHCTTVGEWTVDAPLVLAPVASSVLIDGVGSIASSATSEWTATVSLGLGGMPLGSSFVWENPDIDGAPGQAANYGLSIHNVGNSGIDSSVVRLVGGNIGCREVGLNDPADLALETRLLLGNRWTLRFDCGQPATRASPSRPSSIWQR